MSGPAGPLGPAVIAPVTPASVVSFDRTQWWQWWSYNHPLYLHIDGSLTRSGPVTGDGALLAVQREKRPGIRWQVVYGRVVPELIASLEGESDERVVRQSLLALARIGEAPREAAGRAPAILGTLTAQLRNSRQGIVEGATISLGVFGGTSASSVLNDLLSDTHAGRAMLGRSRVPVRVRALAAYGLGVSGGPSARPAVRRFAVHSLVRALESDSERYSDLQAACVIALGLVQGEPLREGEDAAALPPSAGLELQVRHVLSLFNDPREERMIRTHAPTALARLLATDPTLPAELREAVTRRLMKASSARSKESTAVQRSCIVALGEICDADEDAIDREVRKQLETRVSKGDHGSRHFALIALARMSSRPGTGAGGSLTATASTSRFLLRQLSKGGTATRPWASLALGVMGYHLKEQGVPLSDDTVKALRYAVLSSRSPDEVTAHCLAAGLLGDERLLEAVTAKLERLGGETHKALLAVSLGLLRDDSSVDMLTELMDDAGHEPLIMESTGLARALIGDRSVVQELIERLDDCDCEVSTRGITRALAWTRDGRAVEPLLDLLRDGQKPAAARAHAAAALGRIADRREMAWDVRIAAGLNYLDAPPTLTDPGGYGILDTY